MCKLQSSYFCGELKKSRTMKPTIPQISEFFSTFLSSGGRFNTFVESLLVDSTHSFFQFFSWLFDCLFLLSYFCRRKDLLLVISFSPSIHSKHSTFGKTQQSRAFCHQGGRKEEEGRVSFIGIGGIDDGVPHNAYLRIFTFKIRLPWW